MVDCATLCAAVGGGVITRVQRRLQANDIDRKQIKALLESGFRGLVVVDEVSTSPYHPLLQCLRHLTTFVCALTPPGIVGLRRLQ